MADDAIDNSCGRLYRILVAANGTKAELLGQGFSKLFGHELEDFAAFHLCAVDFVTLVKKCESDITNYLQHQERYLIPFRELKAQLAHLAYRETFGVIKERTTEHKLAAVWFAADALRTRGVLEVSPTADEKTSLSLDAKALRDEIAASDLPTDLKAFLADLVSDVERAVVQFDIRGPEGVQSIIETTFGTIFVRAEQFRQAGAMTEGSTRMPAVVSKVIGFARGATRFASSANTWAKLLENTDRLLGTS